MSARRERLETWHRTTPIYKYLRTLLKKRVLFFIHRKEIVLSSEKNMLTDAYIMCIY